MPGFMLDTDTVSYVLRRQGQVAAHLLSHCPSEIHLSSITLVELRYGAERRPLSHQVKWRVGTVQRAVATCHLP